MFVPELVLMATEVGNITSKAVLNGGLADGGEGGSKVLEALGVAIVLISFGYMGIKWATGAYFNDEE